MAGLTYAKLFPDDWWSGVVGQLNLEEEGLYIRSCMWMWKTGTPVPAKDSVAAAVLHVQVQKYSKVMGSLESKGKMIRTQAGIINERVMQDIDNFKGRSEQRADRAKKGHEHRAMTAEKMRELEEEIRVLRAAVANVAVKADPPHQPPHLPGGGSLGGYPTPPPTGETEKTNENNVPQMQMQSRCTYNPESRIQKEESKESPPTPSGGEEDAKKLRNRAQRAAAKAEAIKANEETLAEAYEVYQKAADFFGFARCDQFTPARKTRLLKRLEAIQGVENFKRALRALRIADGFTDLLRGKKPARDGKGSFRLDFDTLLQDSGNLGDVLGRLLDLDALKGDKGAAKRPWLEWTETEWETQIRQHANGVWPVAKIGPWPSHAECAAPRQVLERLGLATAYDDNGIKRGG